jgi:hypothetical protein
VLLKANGAIKSIKPIRRNAPMAATAVVTK